MEQREPLHGWEIFAKPLIDHERFSLRLGEKPRSINAARWTHAPHQTSILFDHFTASCISGGGALGLMCRSRGAAQINVSKGPEADKASGPIKKPKANLGFEDELFAPYGRWLYVSFTSA